jgi:hypothetical protein
MTGLDEGHIIETDNIVSAFNKKKLISKPLKNHFFNEDSYTSVLDRMEIKNDV